MTTSARSATDRASRSGSMPLWPSKALVRRPSPGGFARPLVQFNWNFQENMLSLEHGRGPFWRRSTFGRTIMPANRIDAILTDEQRDQFMAGLAAMKEAPPFLLDLSAKERIESVKLGEKNRSFAAKALAIAEGHPAILPAALIVIPPYTCRKVQLTRS
jgi:hypothetical protein